MTLISRRISTPSSMGIPETFFGTNSFAALRYIDSEEILVLVSRTVKKSDVFNKGIEKYLKNKLIKIEEITKPTEDEIDQIAEKYKEWPPDCILGIGGGTILDSAKIIRHLLSFPKDTINELSNKFVSPLPSIKLINIPSTPNTGSESNITAVYFNRDGNKIPLINKSFMPDMAILDPQLLLTIPLNLMNEFVSDIFTHAYEGSISRLTSNYFQLLAKYSIELLNNAFTKYRVDNTNLDSLEKILYAGHFAGIIAGNAYVGMIHALGHSLEVITHCRHGEALQILLTPCMTWQLDQESKTNEISKFFLKSWKNLNIDKSANFSLLSNIQVDKWALQAYKDPSIKTDPFKLKDNELLEVSKWIQSHLQ